MTKGVSCPYCHTTKTWQKGYVPTTKGKKPRFICTECGRSFFATKSAPKPKSRSAMSPTAKSRAQKRVRELIRRKRSGR